MVSYAFKQTCIFFVIVHFIDVRPASPEKIFPLELEYTYYISILEHVIASSFNFGFSSFVFIMYIHAALNLAQPGDYQTAAKLHTHALRAALIAWRKCTASLHHPCLGRRYALYAGTRSTSEQFLLLTAQCRSERDFEQLYLMR